MDIGKHALRGVLSALVVSCAVVRQRPPIVEQDATLPALPWLHGVQAPRRSAPGGEIVGKTMCGHMLFIEARERASSRVAIVDHQVPLERGSPVIVLERFWVDDDDLVHAAEEGACTGPVMMRGPRVSDALARALTPPPLVISEPWESFDARLPERFFRLDEAKTSCVEFRIAADSLASATVRWGFSVEHGREIRLTGPTIKDIKYFFRDGLPVVEPDPGKEVSFLCLTHLFVARRTRDTWEVVRRAEEGDVWAYAPAYATRWFGSRAACEREAKHGPVAKIPFANCG